MLRKLLTISIASLFILACTNLSWGSLTGKSFNVTDKLKLKISVKRAGSGSDTETLPDTFNFNGDATFSMEGPGFSGTWSQVKQKFTVNLPYGDLEDYMDFGLDEAFDAALVDIGCSSHAADASSVTLTKYSFKGTESKDGSTIKGKFSFNTSFNLYLYCNGQSVNTTGKTTFTISFTGSKLGLSPGADVLSDGSKSLLEMLGEAARNLISGSAAIPLR